jgi:hypothetical protein
VQEQSARPFCFMLFVAGAFVRLNVDIVEENLSAFDAGEGVVQIGESATDRFDFRAFQFDARLEALEDMKIVKRFAIDGNVSAHARSRRA